MLVFAICEILFFFQEQSSNTACAKPECSFMWAMTHSTNHKAKTVNKGKRLTDSLMSLLQCSSCHSGASPLMVNQAFFFVCAQEQDSQVLRLKTKGGRQKDSINNFSPLKLCSMSPLDCTLLEAQEMETSSASPQWCTYWCLYTTVGFHGLLPPEVMQQRILHY